MHRQHSGTTFARPGFLGRILVLVFSLACTATLAGEAPKQKRFDSPEQAVSALMTAVKAGDAAALVALLGPGARAAVQTGDRAVDRAGYERFARAYDEANKLTRSGDAKAVLVAGKDEWAFPFPIVKDTAGWRFDAAEGTEEVLRRRVGRNEIFTMQSMLAYVDAQREYYLSNPTGAKPLHYARRFISTAGKRDGLYWPVKSGERQSPLGPLFASRGPANAGEGSAPVPYHGYYYRILESQGPDAQGGAYGYVVQGRMMGGFALIAWPAVYGNTGVMTFIVNHDAVIYEKDLGTGTAAAAQKITRFNPDSGWKKAEIQ